MKQAGREAGCRLLRCSSGMSGEAGLCKAGCEANEAASNLRIYRVAISPL